MRVRNLGVKKMVSEQRGNEMVARMFVMVVLLGFFPPNQGRSELISKQNMEERERLSMPPEWGLVTERGTVRRMLYWKEE